MKSKELRNLKKLKDGYKDHLHNPKKYVINGKDPEVRNLLIRKINQLSITIRTLEREEARCG